MTESMAASGKCLCGVVSITVAQFPHEVGACHCSICRNWGGGPLLAAPCGADVSFEGESNIVVYNSSDWAERGFCKTCGTHLFYRIKGNQHYHMPVGLFPDTAFKLTSEVFVDQKPDGYDFADETTKMTGAELFALFAPKS